MESAVTRYNQWRDDVWLELFWNIARKEVAIFENDCVGYSDCLIYLKCRRSIMVWVYQYLIRHKGTPRIEDLDEETKRKMWATVKDICAGKTNDRKLMVEIAKIFYVIEYFLNEKTK